VTKPLSIDVHAHCVPSNVIDRLDVDGPRLDMTLTGSRAADGLLMGGQVETGPIRPDLMDVPRRLASMDASGIDVQILSPWIDLTAYSLSGTAGTSFARLYNEELAAIAAAHPDRFRSVGTVPLQSPVAAAAELHHAVAELGMVGVEIATTVAGRDLDDPDLEPFWAAAEELACLVLLHPCASLAGRGVSRYFLGNLVGNPAESTVAVAHLIFGGVLERHPGLNICVVHGGGFVPYQLGRWDHGYQVNARGAAANLTRLPSEWARGLYYDSVLHSPNALRFAIDTFGVGQIVLGSDYPFEMGDSQAVQTVTDVPGLSETDRDRILSGTISDLIDGVRR
jgi:aminocarboxymuconate-semialdehyde decarboxylase